MPERWGVALIGADAALRSAVADAASGLEVLPPGTPATGLDGVVGVAVEPWPGHGDQHARWREAVGAPYWAVESWHRHPAFLDRLQAAIAAGRARLPDPEAAHVLVTAPDRAGRAGAPEDRVFLRQVTEALAAGQPAGRCTLAWDHSPAAEPVTPTAETVLRSLAEAHGRTAVLRASVDPGDAGDPAVVRTAGDLGVAFAEVALDRGALTRILLAVATTVRDHEGRG